MEPTNMFQQSKIEDKPLISKWRKQQLEWLRSCLLIVGHALVTVAQTGLSDLNYQADSKFEPTIKDAVKFSDLPEIKDSVAKIENIKYGIVSKPVFAKYETQRIEAAKLQNEPLTKLYCSLLK